LHHGPRTVLKAHLIQIHWGDVFCILRSLGLAPSGVPFPAEASPPPKTESPPSEPPSPPEQVAAGDQSKPPQAPPPKAPPSQQVAAKTESPLSGESTPPKPPKPPKPLGRPTMPNALPWLEATYPREDWEWRRPTN